MNWRQSLVLSALALATLTLTQSPLNGQVSLAEKVAAMDSIAESP